MFNVREIIRNNNTTFYDFDTQKQKSQKPRAFVTCIISLIAALVFPEISDDLLSGFLTVQSILLGFTFNMMFFLLGNREKKITASSSIEAQLRAKRLLKLYHELFYNVSYYNFVSVVSIVVALLLLLPTPSIPTFLYAALPIQQSVHWIGSSNTISTASTVLRAAAVFMFYAISIEVIFSMARVIGRTSFYFERKVDEARRLNEEKPG